MYLLFEEYSIRSGGEIKTLPFLLNLPRDIRRYIGIVRILYPRRIDRIKAFQARLVLDFATGPAPWHAQ